MLSCIIIDDEALSIDTLKSIIRNYFSDKLTILGEADNATAGYEIITQNKPDVVFLDIEMPHLNGFDLLGMFENIDFQVIFTTGFDQYALAAIKFSALDYLLKPISITELEMAIQKASRRIDMVENARLIKNVLDTVKTSGPEDTKIPLSLNNEIEMVKVKEIVYCRANQDYTYVNLADGKKILVSKNIKHFEQLLDNRHFFRTHHSYLVNKRYIAKYLKGEGGVILTEFGQEIPVSRRKKTDFLDWVKES